MIRFIKLNFRKRKQAANDNKIIERTEICARYAAVRRAKNAANP
jgi:hypothetical protein